MGKKFRRNKFFKTNILNFYPVFDFFMLKNSIFDLRTIEAKLIWILCERLIFEIL